MNLVRYNPHRRMVSNQRAGSDVFDGFFDGVANPFFARQEGAQQSGVNSLKVDIYEKEEKIIIEAEFAGVKKDDITVDVKGKILTLGGERKQDVEVVEENRYRRERSYGAFERKFSLPFEVEVENISANLNNGLLKLTISKPEAQVAKKITIN
ncbi:MAG: HSP20 family protein [Desulforhopalus sp.]|jgi:HSP20 family protein